MKKVPPLPPNTKYFRKITTPGYNPEDIEFVWPGQAECPLFDTMFATDRFIAAAIAIEEWECEAHRRDDEAIANKQPLPIRNCDVESAQKAWRKWRDK